MATELTHVTKIKESRAHDVEGAMAENGHSDMSAMEGISILAGCRKNERRETRDER